MLRHFLLQAIMLCGCYKLNVRESFLMIIMCSFLRAAALQEWPPITKYEGHIVNLV